MSDATIRIEPDNDNNSAEIYLYGELRITTIEDFLPEMNSVIDKFSKISIIGREIQEIDLPVVQLLLSIKKTLKNEAKEISFDFDLPEISEKSLRNSGLFELIKSNI